MQQMKLYYHLLSMRMPFLYFLRKKQDQTKTLHLKRAKINGRKYVYGLFLHSRPNIRRQAVLFSICIGTFLYNSSHNESGILLS